MKKTYKNYIQIFMASAIFVSSSRAYAIDLNTTTHNTDRSFFNTINSPYKLDKGNFLNFYLGQTENPLVLKRNDGTIVPLIQGLQSFELSFMFGITDWLQMGIMIPGERPYGIVGPYDEAKQYLSNILIEPKIYLKDGIALIPVYYLASSTTAETQVKDFDGKDVVLGKPKGGYGAKLSLGMGDPNKNEVLTAFQIGAIIAPESKFREIDQSNRFQLNAGISVPLSGTLRLLAEAYVEKTKNNTPFEALASIEYKNDDFMLRIGGGKDLQGTGSNTSKLLANFTYYFGDSKKEDSGLFHQPIKRNEDKRSTPERTRPVEERRNNLDNDPMEEQFGPSTSNETESMFAKNELIVQRRSVPTEEAPIPVPKEEIPSAKDVFILAERRKSKEDFAISDDNDDRDNNRQPASADDINTKSIERRANRNLNDAIQKMDYNLHLYQMAKESNNKSLMDAIEIEIRWGLRVFTKNLDSLKSVGKELATPHQAELAQALVDGLDATFPEKTIKTVSVESRLNARSTPSVKADNIVIRLKSGDQVVLLGKANFGEFVQVQLLNNQTKAQLFVDSRFLVDGSVLAKKEEDIGERIEDTKNKISAKYPYNEEGQEPEIDVQEALDELQALLENSFQDRMDLEEKARLEAIAQDKKKAQEKVLVPVEIVKIVIPKEEKKSVEVPALKEEELKAVSIQMEELKEKVLTTEITPVQEVVVEKVETPIVVEQEVKKIEETVQAVEKVEAPVLVQKVEEVVPVVENKIESIKEEVASSVELNLEAELPLTLDTLPALEEPELLKTVVIETPIETKKIAPIEVKEEPVVETKIETIADESIVETKIESIVEEPKIVVQTMDQTLNEQEPIKESSPVERENSAKLPTKLPEKKVSVESTAPPINLDNIKTQDPLSKLELVEIKETPKLQVEVVETVQAPNEEKVEIVQVESSKKEESKLDITESKQTSNVSVETPKVESKLEIVKEDEPSLDELVKQETKVEVVEAVKEQSVKLEVVEKAKEDSKVAVEQAKTQVVEEKETFSLLKKSAEEDTENQAEKMAKDKKAFEKEMAEQKILEDRLKEERISRIKEEELKKIDAIMEKQSPKPTTSLIEASESDKEVVKQAPSVERKVHRDALFEEDAMEEQNGPTFDDL